MLYGQSHDVSGPALRCCCSPRTFAARASLPGQRARGTLGSG